VGQYDFALSTQYRDWFQVMLGGTPQLRGALQGSGPFLVATRVPMNELVATAAGQRTDHAGFSALECGLPVWPGARRHRRLMRAHASVAARR
jgi:hypothetical protein